MLTGGPTAGPKVPRAPRRGRAGPRSIPRHGPPHRRAYGSQTACNEWINRAVSRSATDSNNIGARAGLDNAGLRSPRAPRAVPLCMGAVSACSTSSSSWSRSGPGRGLRSLLRASSRMRPARLWGPWAPAGTARGHVGPNQSGRQEVDQQSIDLLGCLKLHPMPRAVEPLVAPQAGNVPGGIDHLALGERNIS